MYPPRPTPRILAACALLLGAAIATLVRDAAERARAWFVRVAGWVVGKR